MAIFEIADQLTRKNEGGYANNRADAGGETYKGIARNFWPKLALWKYVDLAKNDMGTVHDGNAKDWAKRLNANLEQIPALQKMVDEFYRANFWQNQGLDLITSQPVANWIYDHHVNAGARGIKWAQEAAGVTADGQIGSKSIAAINAMEPADFLHKATDIAAFYRLDRALADRSQVQFLPSWLRRDGVSEGEIKEVMAMAANGLTMEEVKTLKGMIEAV